jgi:hypothetical protein
MEAAVPCLVEAQYLPEEIIKEQNNRYRKLPLMQAFIVRVQVVNSSSLSFLT